MKNAQRYDIECKTALSAYKYLYNGKELQDEMGLEVYDFHSRYYDAVIGRFMSQREHTVEIVSKNKIKYKDLVLKRKKQK
ncbi:MAG: hypothetical protein ACLFN1_09280 [Bacteroidales bacterium]